MAQWWASWWGNIWRKFNYWPVQNSVDHNSVWDASKERNNLRKTVSTSVVHGTHVHILVLGSVTGKHIWKICKVNGCMKVTKVYFLTLGDLNIPYNVETVWVSFDQCPNPWQTGGATGYCPKKRVKRQPGRWTIRRFLRYLHHNWIIW